MKKIKKISDAPRINKLKNAATNLLLSGGFDSLSIDALVRKVGGSKRNIYENYGDKETFFVKIVTDLCEEICSPLEHLTLNDGPPQKALEEFTAQSIEAALQPRSVALYRIMISEAKRFPRLSKAIWHSGYIRVAEILENWILQQQKKGFLSKKTDARTLSYHYMSLITGYLLLAVHVDPKAVKMSKSESNKYGKNLVNTFISGNSK
jgi:AcrR family transcriptional regulator